MKHAFRVLGFVLALAAVGAIGCSDDDVINPRTIHGSGVPAQDNRAVSGFSGVTSTTIGDLYIAPGAAEALRIVAEDNLLSHIVSEVRGGTLELRTASGVTLDPTRPIEFHITVTSLDSVVQAGVGDVDIDGPAMGNMLLRLTGVGTVRCSDLAATDLDVRLIGVGEVETAGQTDHQEIQLVGVGEYDGRNLASATADVTISGLGDATVRVSDSLVALISGDGDVYYIGDPTVQSTITGTGSVTQIP